MAPPSASASLEHPALLYASLDDFLAATVPFLTSGVEETEVIAADPMMQIDTSAVPALVS